MQTPRFHRRAVASALALAMVVSACGSDEDTTESSATTEAGETTETEVPAPTGEPIKFGTTIWTLEQLSLTLRIPGIEAAVADINAHGGINGRPVEWVYCPAADPNEGEACARQMAEAGVVATISDANLAAEGPATQILADAGIPQIDPFINSPAALNSPNVFMFGQGTPIEYAGVVAFMKEKELETIHFLSAAMSQAVNSEAAVTAAAEFYEIELDGKTEIPMSATDYSPYLAAADDTGADINMTIIAPFMSGLVLQAAQQLGLQAKVGLSEGQFGPDQVKQFAPELEGSLLIGAVPPFSAADDYPEVERALAAMEAYYEESGDALAAPEKLSTLALRSWFAVQAFAKVAAGIDGDVTKESVKAGFDTAEIDLGLDHPWKPSNPGPEGYTRVSNPYLYLVEVKDGESVLFQDEPIDGLLPFQG